MRGGRKVGGDVPAPRYELVVCCLVAAASLAIAAFCHRFAPGFGPVFKPLLWPLLVLPFTVRLRYALVTSFVVPLISCAATGMPTLPVAMALSAVSAAFIAVVTVAARRMVGGDVPAPRNHDTTHNALGNRLRSAEDVRPYRSVTDYTVVGGDVPAPRSHDVTWSVPRLHDVTRW